MKLPFFSRPIGYGVLELGVEALNFRIRITVKGNQFVNLANGAVPQKHFTKRKPTVAHNVQIPALYGFARQIKLNFIRFAAAEDVSLGCVNQKSYTVIGTSCYMSRRYAHLTHDCKPFTMLAA